MQLIINNNLQKIQALCSEHYVKELYAFGSVVRDDFGPDSDVDFLIEYDDLANTKDPLGNMLSLKAKLESLLKRGVDLIEYKELNNKYLKYFIDKEKRMLYA